MIQVEFVIQDNKILAFSVEGHSGLAPAPHDILCASVSAMTQLVINTVTDVFGAKIDLEINEEIPRIRAELLFVSETEKNAVFGVLGGFQLQLEDLRKMYPAHIKVSEVTKQKG